MIENTEKILDAIQEAIDSGRKESIVETMSRVIEEARSEGYDAALADAARTLKHCGLTNAAKQIDALAADQQAVRQKKGRIDQEDADDAAKARK